MLARTPDSHRLRAPDSRFPAGFAPPQIASLDQILVKSWSYTGQKYRSNRAPPQVASLDQLYSQALVLSALLRARCLRWAARANGSLAGGGAPPALKSPQVRGRDKRLGNRGGGGRWQSRLGESGTA